MLGALEQAFFNGPPTHQSIDVHQFGLPNPMHPAHGLGIGLRVPIAVVDDTGIGSLQTQAHAATSRTHEKQKIRRMFGIELMNQVIAFGSGNTSIESAVLKNVKEEQKGRSQVKSKGKKL